MLPNDGKISMLDIAKELGKEGQRISLNDEDVLKLAGKTSGGTVVIPNDFWGKEKRQEEEYPYSLEVRSYGQVYMYNLHMPFLTSHIKSITIYSTFANFVFNSELDVKKIQIYFKSGESFILQQDSDFKSTYKNNNIPIDIRKYASQTIYFRMEAV